MKKMKKESFYKTTCLTSGFNGANLQWLNGVTVPIPACVLLLLISLPVLAVDISVTIDRNPLNINESAQIVFSASEEPDQDPDFTPLDQDFEILNRQRSSNVSMINGSVSRRYTWTLTVMPKHTGNIEIPAISFGNDRSRPGSVVVNELSNRLSDDAAAGKDLFLSVEATPLNPYVQGQVIYTLKFYRRVGITQASLTEPKLDDAVIEKLGEDKNYNTRIDGRSYTVTERKYAIFPQQSGPLVIQPLSLTAQIITGQRSRYNGFFGSQSTYNKRVTSKAITLDVRPAEKNFTGRQWLPAEQLYLKEQWSGDTENLKTGEPVTRTLTLLATGTTVSQLPELNEDGLTIQSDTQGELKSYPDQPVLQERQKADGVVSLREEKIAFIPSKKGVYQLPAIEIPWWNTKTQHMEIAKIPARKIIAVSPATSQIAVPIENRQMQRTVPENTGNSVTPPAPPQNSVWIWISVFLACGWLLTVIYFLAGRRHQTIEQTKPKEDNRVVELKKACRMNDAIAAKNILIQWGRKQFNVSNLSKIALCCNDDLKEQISLLNRYLYDPGTDKWCGGNELLLAFKRFKHQNGKQAQNDEVLQPLYKT